MKPSPPYFPPGFHPQKKVRSSAQSELWSARAPNGAKVALKLASSATGQQQILHEFQILRELADLGVPQCHGLYASETHAALAIEWIDGCALDEWWADASHEARRLMLRRTLDVVSALHRRGLCHGDLKPEHILIVEPDEGGAWPCIVDFGLSVPMGMELQGGTPEYFAPERLRDPIATRSVDLYCLGLSFLQVALGKATPPSPATLAPSMGLLPSGDLKTILPQCLDSNPAKRWKTVESLMTRLAPLRAQVQRPRLGLLAYCGQEAPLKRLEENVHGLLRGTQAPVTLHIVGPEGIGRRRLIREARLKCLTLHSQVLFLEWVVGESFALFITRIFRTCGWSRTLAEPIIERLTSPRNLKGLDPTLGGQQLAALLEEQLGERMCIWTGLASPHLDPTIKSCIEALRTSESARFLQARNRRFAFWIRHTTAPETAQKSGLEESIPLQPLRPLHYQNILGRLFPATDPRDCNEAAQLLWSHTKGNPGALTRLLRSLLAKGEIHPRQVGAFLTPEAVNRAQKMAAGGSAIESLSNEGLELGALLAFAPIPLTRYSLMQAAPQGVRELEHLLDLGIAGEHLDPEGGSPCFAITSSALVRELKNRLSKQAAISLHQQLHDHAPTHAQRVWHQAHTPTPPLESDVKKAALTLRNQGQVPIALELLETLRARAKAESEFAALDTPELQLCLAEIKASAGLFDEAREEFLRICTHHEGSDTACLARMRLVKLASATGEIEAALELAASAAENLPNPKLHHEVFTTWAGVLFTAGRLDEALSKAMKAGPPATADNFGMRGYILSRFARDEEAISAYGEAQRLLVAEGRSDEADTVGVNIALIEMRQGLLDRAHERFVAAERACRKLGMPLRQAQVMTNRAILLSRQGQLPKSAHLHALAAQRLEDIGEPVRAQAAHASRGLAELAQGFFAPALSILSSVERSLDRSGAWPRAQAQVLAGLALCHGRTGRRARGRSICARGFRLAHRMNDISCMGTLFNAADKLSRSQRERDLRLERWQRNVELTQDAQSQEKLTLARTESALKHRQFDRARSWLTESAESEGTQPKRRLLSAHAWPERKAHELAAGLRCARRMSDRRSEWLIGVESVSHLMSRKRRRAAQRLFTRCVATWNAMETDMTERQRSFFRISEAGEKLKMLSEQIEAELGELANPQEQRTIKSRVELLSLIARLNSQDDEQAIVRSTLDGVLRLTGAEGAYLILRNRDDSLDFTHGRLSSGQSAKNPSRHVSTTLVHEVLAEQQAVIVANAAEDPRYRGLISVSSNELHAVACVPLLSHGSPMGVVWIDGGASVPYFESSEIPVLEGFAHCAALALSASRRRNNVVAQLETQRLQAEASARKDRVASAASRPMIGASAKFQNAKNLLTKSAQSDLPVHVSGESGTGKELFASQLHAESSRSSGPWVVVNAAAIPEGLAESELFGFEQGSFSGANKANLGLIRQADGGTLFIDEVGEMPLSIQARLLRVLQEKEVRPVGGGTVSHVDFRLVTSSRHDLQAEVASGRFREDLWFRIKTICIHIPPLRFRKDDILMLAKSFLMEEGKPSHLAPEVEQALLAAPWPGNVRELENVIKRAAVMATGSSLQLEDLGPEFSAPLSAPTSDGVAPGAQLSDSHRALPSSMAEWEQLALETALKRSGGDRKEAARLLGISRTTLYAKLKRLRDHD